MASYPQFSINEILAVFRRRKKFFLFPFILISVICISGAFLLPQKYKSSITMSVQKDAVLNPLVSYTMAVTAASDDRMKNFDEIVFSRLTIKALIDSLGLDKQIHSKAEEEELIKVIKADIETELRGSDSFTIDFFDPVPARAQKAARILSEIFIKRRLEVSNKENELAVEFFENKLKELGDKFEHSQEKYISAVKSSVMPGDDYELSSHLSDLASSIGVLDDNVTKYQTALKILRNTQLNFDDPSTITSFHDLVLLDVPDADILKDLLLKYEDVSKKYTSNFPDIIQLRSKISDLTSRIKHAVELGLTRQQNQVFGLQQQRNNILGTMRSAEVSKNQNEDVKSTYDVYSKLYNDMKIKLEQARTARDLGEKGAEQFTIIDPPELPVHPAKPNKILLIAGGTALGLFVGLLSAGFMELFDTRIRTTKDIEMFDKPVLAYLPTTNK
jgi:succinoglycan biosynthesis transport protein ExoP